MVSERVELLTEIRNIYKKRFDDIATAIQTEMGAPNSLARGSQATVGLSHLKTAIRVLENHKFENIQNLFWRNSDLNFDNPLSLIRSLDKKPLYGWLRKIHECEDEKALKFFLREKNIEKINFNEHKLKVKIKHGDSYDFTERD